MLIGELAKATGFSHDTIRYYEKIGLIRVERRARRINGFKEYPERMIDQLRFIRWAKGMGLSLSEIQEMFQMKKDQDLQCEDMKEWAQEKLREMDARIEALKSAREKLGKALEEEARCSTEQCRLEERKP